MDGGYDRGEVWRETERRGAKEKGYGRRNKVEAIFSRLKGIFGDRVRARSLEGRGREIGERRWMLYRMMEMGGGVWGGV